jgi:hypothetical protein
VALSERNMLVMGALLSVFGLGIAVAASENVGAGFTIVGTALGVWGLHRFGRTGADDWTAPKNEPQR